MKQRVILNGEVSSWTVINAGDPLGSILRLLLFYINNIADGLSSNAKHFRWYIFIFGRDVEIFANELNNELYQINESINQLK